MEITVVAKNRELPVQLAQILEKLEVSIEWHSSPTQALSSFRRKLPTLLCYSASDFPDHWLLTMGYLLTHKSHIHIALMTKEKLHYDSGAESILLGVNQIIPTSIDEEDQRELWYQFLEKVPEFHGVRKEIRESVPLPKEGPLLPWLSKVGLSMEIEHPESKEKLRGEIEQVTAEAIQFYPETPIKTIDIEERMIVLGKLVSEVEYSQLTVVENNLILSLVPIDTECEEPV